ncbi:sugar kinase [Nocardioides sp.]|uniref:sugar kinase n=1 Tax=Nocardioides sp. TaxID=35761 RepID=UPI002ED97583
MDLVTIGEALGVFAPIPDGALRPGGTASFAVGGAELNVAVGLARLGHRVSWVGRVGDDAAGRAIRTVLRAESVHDECVRTDPDAATGIYVKETVGLRGLRVSYHRAHSAATQMEIAEADFAYLLSGRILHLTGITPALSTGLEELMRELLARATTTGVTVSFDANIRHRLLVDRAPVELLEPFVSAADMVFLSASEAEELLGIETVDDAVDQFATLRAKALVVHCASGAYAVDHGGVETVEARSLQVVDPVGAGDAFVAGYLSGHLRGWSTRQCLSLAELCAAHVVTVAGDHDGFPTEPEALAALGVTASRAER